MAFNKRSAIAFAEQLIYNDPSSEDIGSYFKSIAADIYAPPQVRFRAHLLKDYFEKDECNELLENFIDAVKKA